MSSRKLSNRRVLLRRGRARRMWLPSDDDVPLSLLVNSPTKQPKTQKKATPRKRPNTKAVTVTAAPAEVITLDDTSESIEIADNVNSKVDNFMQSGCFISSDEDETEMIKDKTNKKPSPNQFFISDDSDDECKVVKASYNSTKFDSSAPSTSAGTSKDSSKNELSETIFENIMDIVDSVLDKEEPKKDTLNDMKSLEDYRKKTEELLKNTSSLLDEITKRKPEPEKEKKELDSPKVTIGACPICLESLAGRLASVTVCGHIFCKECILQVAKTLKKCPTCRKTINNKKIHPIYF